MWYTENIYKFVLLGGGRRSCHFSAFLNVQRSTRQCPSWLYQCKCPLLSLDLSEGMSSIGVASQMVKKFYTGCVKWEQVKSLYEISSLLNVLQELFLVEVTCWKLGGSFLYWSRHRAGSTKVKLPLLGTLEPLKACLLCASVKGEKEKINSLYCQLIPWMNLLCILVWSVLQDLVVLGTATGALGVQVTGAQCEAVGFKGSSWSPLGRCCECSFCLALFLSLDLG